MLLYRVFPYLEGGNIFEPGGAIYMPPQGSGRAENPDHYSVVYAGDSEAGVIAEAFGRFPEWGQSMLNGSPSLPGSHRALAKFSLPVETAICNLDDPAQLIELSLRPSQVVTRDYRTSQDWALAIFERQRWNGVKWWSYFDSRWFSYALWNHTDVAPSSIRPIHLDDAALAEAAEVLTRRIVSPVRKKPRAV